MPIIITTSFGLSPASSPLSSRHSTCSVRSPLKPKFAALSAAKLLSQAAFPAPSHPCVIESPRNARSTPPFFVTATLSAWRWTHQVSLSRGTGVVAICSGLTAVAGSAVETEAKHAEKARTEMALERGLIAGDE